MKMDYLYLGTNVAHYEKVPTEPFKAVRMKENNGEYRFYPVIEHQMYGDKSELFIYGHGHIKMGKRKTYEVPLFSGNAEDWNDYLTKWGAPCLYYAVSGKDYGSWDCCNYMHRQEFISICQYGAVGYVEFVRLFRRFSEIQREAICEKYFPVMGISKANDYWLDKYMFKPCYSLMSIVSIGYTPDVLGDDKKMEDMYMWYRKMELIHNNPNYPKYEEMNKVLKEVSNNADKSHWDWEYKTLTPDGRTYEVVRNENDDLYTDMSKSASEQARKEVSEDNQVFPTSVSDRIKYLFGDEAHEIYNELVDKFLDSKNTKKVA